MIEAKDLIPLLVQSYPRLRDHLVKTANDWLGEDGTLMPCMLMAAVGWLVAERLAKGDFDGMDRLFDLVERLLLEGSSEVRDAAATCFLENLVNRSDTLDPRLYVALLGPESRNFCCAWDELTGQKTPGLW